MGPDGARRLLVATADPGALPDKATWYLVTNLPRPGGPREEDSPWPAAGLAEIVRIPTTRTRRTVAPTSTSNGAPVHPATEYRLTLHRRTGSPAAEHRLSRSAICTISSVSASQP